MTDRHLLMASLSLLLIAGCLSAIHQSVASMLASALGLVGVIAFVLIHVIHYAKEEGRIRRKHKAEDERYEAEVAILELVEGVRKSVRDLSTALESVKVGATKDAGDHLLLHAREFLKHAAKAPEHIHGQQRFVRYYIPTATSLLRAQPRMEDSETLSAAEGKVLIALTELRPIFAHYAARMAHAGVPDMDVELKLLRSSIVDDMPWAVPAHSG